MEVFATARSKVELINICLLFLSAKISQSREVSVGSKNYSTKEATVVWYQVNPLFGREGCLTTIAITIVLNILKFLPVSNKIKKE